MTIVGEARGGGLWFPSLRRYDPDQVRRVQPKPSQPRITRNTPRNAGEISTMPPQGQTAQSVGGR